MAQHATVQSPCHQSWSKMTGSSTRRFCKHCEKHVHWIDALDPRELQWLVRKNQGNLCVRFNQAPKYPWTTQQEQAPAYHWLRRSGVALGLAAFALGASAQDHVIHGFITSETPKAINHLTSTVTLRFENGTEFQTVPDLTGHFRIETTQSGPFDLTVENNSNLETAVKGTLDAFSHQIELQVPAVRMMGTYSGPHPIYQLTTTSHLRTAGPETSPLVKAIADRNLDEVQRLLDSGLSVHERTKYGDTLLMVSFRSLEIADLLISRGADVNAQNDFGVSVLSFSLLGSSELTLSLLDQGANPNLPDDQGITPLMIAALNGDLTVFEAMLDRGGTWTAKDHYGQGLLHYAAMTQETQSTDVIEKLAHANQINLNEKDIWGETALMKAALMGRSDTVKVLIQAGSETDHRNLWGHDAALLASFGSNLETLALLAPISDNLPDHAGHSHYDHLEYDYLMVRFDEMMRGVTDISNPSSL
ncbi:MAG: ankyrin repeat domain-containing protein [Acidobacteria bacterium]|nr:ankyrin repeat domain-containing protein [Acidobacteriota bacterium]